MNLTSCVTTFGVPSSFNTGVPSAYTYVIVRVTVLFRSFSSNPAGYLGPSGVPGVLESPSTGVPGVFGLSGVTGTTLSFTVTVNSWSLVESLSKFPVVGYSLLINSYPWFSNSVILALISLAFVNGSFDLPSSTIGVFPSTVFSLPSWSKYTNLVIAFWISDT